MDSTSHIVLRNGALYYFSSNQISVSLALNTSILYRGNSVRFAILTSNFTPCHLFALSLHATHGTYNPGSLVYP